MPVSVWLGMAALKIGRTTSKQEVTKKDKGQSIGTKSPIFTVQYLGKLPARGEYGREYISEPVECLLKLKERQRLPKTTLSVSEKGFHFLDQNGPFGKERHILIPLHNICYGVADEQSPRVFAIITRTDSNSDSSLFECHAFLCDKRKTSSEITYWLLRTFLQVFEELQKKRRLRQEKKLLRRQQNLGSEDAAEMARDERVSKSRSSYDSKMPLETGSYSVLLEGSKGHGAAVGLTLNKSKSRQGHNPTSNRTGRGFEQPSRTSDRDLNANFYSRSEHGPLMAVNAEIHPHRPTSQTHQRVPHQRSIPDGRNTYIYSGGIQAIPTNHAAQQRSTPKTTHVAQKQKQSSGNYTKLSSHSSNTNIKDRPSQSQSSVHDESDFLFIDLLQEEFADERHKGGFPVRSGRKGALSVRLIKTYGARTSKDGSVSGCQPGKTRTIIYLSSPMMKRR